MENDTPLVDRLTLLTPKERDCLRLVMERHSSKQIARQLGISSTSVDTYVRRAREKLGLKDRYAAARLLEAWQQGEVEIAPSGAAAEPAEPAEPPRAEGLLTLRIPPLETLNIFQRIVLIIGGAIAAAVIFGVIATAMTAL